LKIGLKLTGLLLAYRQRQQNIIQFIIGLNALGSKFGTMLNYIIE
jgi:hypothetical protein